MAELLLSCPSEKSGAFVFVELTNLKNAKVTIYINGQKQVVWKKNNWEEWHITLPTESKVINLRMALVPEKKSKLSTAVVMIGGEKIPNGYDACMSSKDHMKKLSEGSPDSWADRNFNPRQYQCVLSPLCIVETGHWRAGRRHVMQ